MPTEDIFKVVNHHDYDDIGDDDDNLDAQEAQRQRPASLSVKKPSFLRSASGGADDDGFDVDYDDGDYYHYHDDDDDDDDTYFLWPQSKTRVLLGDLLLCPPLLPPPRASPSIF